MRIILRVTVSWGKLPVVRLVFWVLKKFMSLRLSCQLSLIFFNGEVNTARAIALEASPRGMDVKFATDPLKVVIVMAPRRFTLVDLGSFQTIVLFFGLIFYWSDRNQVIFSIFLYLENSVRVALEIILRRTVANIHGSPCPVNIVRGRCFGWILIIEVCSSQGWIVAITLF